MRISDWSSDVCSSDLLRTRRLDIIDAGPFIGYSPERLDSQGASGAIRNDGGRPSVLPHPPLAGESLGNVDADVPYRVAGIRADYFTYSTVHLPRDHEQSHLAPSSLTIQLTGGTTAQ